MTWPCAAQLSSTAEVDGAHAAAETMDGDSNQSEGDTLKSVSTKPPCNLVAIASVLPGKLLHPYYTSTISKSYHAHVNCAFPVGCQQQAARTGRGLFCAKQGTQVPRTTRADGRCPATTCTPHGRGECYPGEDERNDLQSRRWLYPTEASDRDILN